MAKYLTKKRKRKLRKAGRKARKTIRKAQGMLRRWGKRMERGQRGLPPLSDFQRI